MVADFSACDDEGNILRTVEMQNGVADCEAQSTNRQIAVGHHVHGNRYLTIAGNNTYESWDDLNFREDFGNSSQVGW